MGERKNPITIYDDWITLDIMDKLNESKGLIEFIKAHRQVERASFHMPGHKGRRFFDENGYGDFVDIMIDGDMTEIEGADNLFKPEGVLREIMNRYKAMYAVNEAFLLVGGSSVGIIASIMSVLSKGDTLIMASNCHKSVYNALMLSGGKAAFVLPETAGDYGLAGKIDPEKIAEALKENPQAKAVLITSPNYYGICSDVEKIAELVHSYGKLLIVDEAHGAHLRFLDGLKVKGDKGYRKLAAENCGADIVIVSTHKTLASFTQTAVLLVCGERADIDVIADNLQILESSSPSYILMSSLDINARLVEDAGDGLFSAWQKDIDYAYDKLSKIYGLELFDTPFHDRTKLVFSFRELGISGYELDRLLREQGIFAELSDSCFVMAMTGIGNKRSDYDALISTLSEISDTYARKDVSGQGSHNAGYAGGGTRYINGNCILHAELYEHGEIFDISRKAERVELREAEGRISAQALIPYPPGIPVIVPGERIDERKLRALEILSEEGVTIVGMDKSRKILCAEV